MDSRKFERGPEWFFSGKESEKKEEEKETGPEAQEQLKNGKEETYEKIKDPWTEEVEVSGNKIKLHHTGLQRYDPKDEKPVWEIKDIEIVTSEGKRFDFASLLPKGWRFAKEQGLSTGYPIYARYDIKEITFPETWQREKISFSQEQGVVIEREKMMTISRPGILLMLLHEIGHAHRGLTRKEWKVRTKLEKKGEFGKLSRKEKEWYHRYVIASERDAWAYALGQYRRLKQEGIDISPRIKSNKQLLEFVHGQLDTYLVGLSAYPELGTKESIKRKILEHLRQFFRR